MSEPTPHMAFVNALREMLGLEPLYGSFAKSKAGQALYGWDERIVKRRPFKVIRARA